MNNIELTDFTVTLKMARKTGSLADEVEHRTFTVTGPARNAKQAEGIAFGLGHGINEATGHAWKFCGGSEGVTVTPAGASDEAEQLRTELNEALPQITAAWIALDKAGFQSPVAGIAELIDQLAADLAERDAQLTKSREQAATLANEVGNLTAENARVRQQRDEAKAELEHRRVEVNELRAALQGPVPNDPQGTGWTQGDNFHGDAKKAEATR